jgi:hypothetical protein
MISLPVNGSTQVVSPPHQQQQKHNPASILGPDNMTSQLPMPRPSEKPLHPKTPQEQLMFEFPNLDSELIATILEDQGTLKEARTVLASIC